MASLIVDSYLRVAIINPSHVRSRALTSDSMCELGLKWEGGNMGRINLPHWFERGKARAFHFGFKHMKKTWSVNERVAGKISVSKGG